VWQAVVVPTTGAVGNIGFTLKGSGVVDSANNPNAEVSAALQPFDTQAPNVVSGNPAAGAIGVVLGSNIALTFNEAVARGTGSITLRDAAGVATETFDAASSTRLTLSGSTLTIDPSVDLVPSTVYSVVFANGSVRDLAGNGLNSSGLVPYSFTTAVPIVPTALTGTNANDTFTPVASIKSIDGLGGIDTASFGGARSGYALSSAAGVFKVSSIDGARKVDLSQVERLAFDNQRLAVDIDGHAGTVAKILGAVFGKTSVTNAEYVGIGLSLLDGGMSYSALMQLALDTRLGAKASSAAVVDLLYTNVVGVAPSASDRAFYVGLLDTQVYTPASLGVLAADTDLNKVSIDLVGLAQSGLPYVLA
jgi:methionine-rich copper-binding protein CopC